MINLLPEKDKMSVRREYYVRYYSAVLFGIALIALLVSVIVLPFYFSVSSKLKAAGKDSGVCNAGQCDPSVMENYNRLADTLKILNKGAGAKLVDYLIELGSSGTKGIAINSIMYDRATSRFVISGEAGSRDGLKKYSDSLRSMKGYLVSDVPVSDYAKDKNIIFTINISPAK